MGDSHGVTLSHPLCHLNRPGVADRVPVSDRNRVLSGGVIRMGKHKTPDFNFRSFALFRWDSHKTRADTCGTILIFKE